MVRLFIISLVLILPVSASATDPTLPLDTFTPSIAPALQTPCPHAGVCNTTAEVTTALASAQFGDWILLNHSNTFTAPSSGWTLPAIAGTGWQGSSAGVSAVAGSSGAHAVSGSSGVSATTGTGAENWLVITTDNYALLPASLTTVAGRINTSDATNMPAITGTGANIQATFLGAEGVHHVQIRGLNFTTPAVNGSGACANVAVCGFIFITPTNATGHLPSEVHHIAIDQNLMTADATLGAINGIHIAGEYVATRNNRLTNVFDPTNAQETHGILHHAGQYFTTTGNEVCAQSVPMWGGDSLVSFWSGGTYGSGSPIGLSDVTIRWNYVHKNCIPSGARGLEKNLLEGKYWNRVLVDSNVFDTTYQTAQDMCIALVSARGSQSYSADITFTNNWIKNCPSGMTLTLRPSEQIGITGAVSDAGTGCSGGPCVKLTLTGSCDCTTGDMVDVSGVLGVTEANGTWLPITRIDSTHITLPVAWAAHTFSSGGLCDSGTHACAQFWFQGTPVQRVLIENNLWTDIGKAAQSIDGRHAFAIGTSPTIVPASGTDCSISTLSATDCWKPHDIQIKKNTFINPTAGQFLTDIIHITEANGRSHAANTDWHGERWVIQDNVFHSNRPTSGNYSITAYDDSGSDVVGPGTVGLNFLSNPATRTFDHNIGYESVFSDDATKYTGGDSWTLISMTGCSVVVFVDCSTSSIAAAALQAGSPGHAAASDGVSDIGFDATVLATKLVGVTP